MRSAARSGSLTSTSAPRMLLAMCAAPVELHGVPRSVQPIRTVRLRAPPWYPASAGKLARETVTMPVSALPSG